MTKVLFVTRRDLLSVPGGDTLRAINLLELLRCDPLVDTIDILYIGGSRNTSDFSRYGFCEKLGSVYNFEAVPRRFVWFFMAVFRFLFFSRSLSFNFFSNFYVDNFIFENRERYARVVYHLARGVNFRYVREVDFIDFTDAISMNYFGAQFSFRDVFFFPLMFLKKILMRLDARSVLREELKLLSCECEVSVISNRDKVYLEKSFFDEFSYRRSIRVIPNLRHFLDFRSVPESFVCSDFDGFLFIGNLRSVQNLDGVYFFLDSVLPMLNSRLSANYKLIIAGFVPVELAKELSKRDDVVVFGVFNSLNDLRSLNVIGVAPIRQGAGLQNKIVDYVDLEIDFVSTSLALSGLDLDVDLKLYCADSPLDFVEVLEFLLSSPTSAEVLREKKTFFAKRFGFEGFDFI